MILSRTGCRLAPVLARQGTMLTFKVRVNGEPAVLGGMEGLASLHLQVHALNERPTYLSLGGIAENRHEHVKWLGRELAVGDRVVLEVVETEDARSVPERSPGEDPERLYYELSKAAYFRMRDKYEPGT